MNWKLLRNAIPLLVLGIFLCVPTNGQAQLKINQIYGGGGMDALGYKYDFVELINTSNAPVAYTNVYIFVGFYNGTHYNVTVPNVDVVSKGYFLIRFDGTPSNTGADLTNQDFDAGTIPLPGGNTGDNAVGVVMLYSVNPNNPSSCNVTAGLLDKVSYGGFIWSNCYEGTPSFLYTDGTHSLQRKVVDGNAQDTDNNQDDFERVAPNPRNTESQPLPVQLVSMTAFFTSDRSVQISWRTASEIDNFGFIVERRNGNTTEFAELPGSFKQGHGTTLESHEYSFTDANVVAGVEYQYRIKQIDLNGDVHYSEIFNAVENPTAVAEHTGIAKEFTLQQNYPNPFNPSTMIAFTVKESGTATLSVYNTLGQKVSELFNEHAQAGVRYTLRFDAASLSTGLYLAKLESGGQMATMKMTLVK